MAESVLDVVNVSKSFGTTQVLDNVSLSINAGETVCIMGPSGAGKTTLLRCMNLLERPTSGAIFLDGELFGYEERGDHLVELSDRRTAKQRLKTGMVFQSFNLFPHLSVLRNVTLGPVSVLGQAPSQAREVAMDCLGRVGLAAFADKAPSSLSGGQQQRVAIARCLAMGPEVMLFDEPTSALDVELVSEVLATMRDLSTHGTTMVVVTHELGFAREVAARAIFMDGGRIVDDGTIDSVLRETTNPRIKQFISKVLV